MYTLTPQQSEAFQNFLNKLEETMVRSHLQKWFNEVTPTQRVTSEQLEKLLSFQNGLPKELQSYPQSFAAWLKNGELSHETENSINDLEDKSSSENVEETLHDLGNIKGKKVGVKKATDKKKKK